jgi:GABA(A) receptor-associated protein
MFCFLRKIEFKYKTTTPLKDRKKKAEEIIKKYPDKVPIILERAPNSDINIITSEKYVIPGCFDGNQLLYSLQYKLPKNSNQSLFLLIEGKITFDLKTKLIDLYNKYKNNCLVTFLWDKGTLLGYKDSPIDCGKDTFLQLFKERIVL